MCKTARNSAHNFIPVTDNMEVVDLTGDDNDEVGIEPAVDDVVRVLVFGQPKALPRMRYFRNGFYNPARGDMAAFRAAVRAQNHATMNGVVFGRGVPVAVTVWFHMKRPKSDFKSGHRMAGMLRQWVPCVRPIRPDVDNLAKFVLDGMNGLVYEDDRQVVELLLFKLMDSEGDCGGRTVIKVSKFVGPTTV